MVVTGASIAQHKHTENHETGVGIACSDILQGEFFKAYSRAL